jgi:hypothetical protein
MPGYIIQRYFLRTAVVVGILTTCVAPALPARTTADAQNIAIDSDLQIPGAVLTSGTYTLAIKDNLVDRSIVEISSGNNGKRYLLIAVPGGAATNDAGKGISLFAANNREQILRGWLCPDCRKELQFVYSKQEAGKIVNETAQPVFAFDAAYDKLPAELSESNMKLVTLWSLSPERIDANHGVGIKAVKYSSGKAIPEATVASAKHLPKTASDNFSLALYGAILLTASFGLRRLRAAHA